MEEAPKKSKNPYDNMDIADTNLANIGTDLDHKIKEAAAQQEDAWKSVGKRMGLTIWRIEKFKVKAWPETDYGHFYKGDSYIILNTYKVQEKVCFNAHFWLGLESTADEYGTAAYKTTELSDYIHGNFGARAVHYREVMGEESNLFDKYFGDKLFYMDGGIESGFHHVKPEEYEPRLIQIKGKKKIKAWEVERAATSLNHGDIFILDLGARVLQWNGAKSNGMEKARAAKFVQHLEGQRKGKSKGDVIDGFDSEENQKEFFEPLGGSLADVHSESCGVSDSEFDESNTKGNKKLFRVNDKTGMTLEAEGEKVREFELDGKDIFILDMAGLAVYEWVGDDCSNEEKGMSLKLAVDYCKSIGKPRANICRVHQGHEHEEFWSDYRV